MEIYGKVSNEILLPSIEIVLGSFLLISLIASLTRRCCWVSKIVNATPINKTRTITGINRKRTSLFRVLLFMDELVWGFHSVYKAMRCKNNCSMLNKFDTATKINVISAVYLT